MRTPDRSTEAKATEPARMLSEEKIRAIRRLIGIWCHDKDDREEIKAVFDMPLWCAVQARELARLRMENAAMKWAEIKSLTENR